MGNTKHSILLRAKTAGVVLATVFVMLECGWVSCGGILRLAGGNNPYLPNFPNFGETSVAIFIGCSVLLALGQLFTLSGRCRAAGAIVGAPFLIIGSIGVGLTLLGQILEGHEDGDSHSLTEVIATQSFVASWLFIGLTNLLVGRKAPGSDAACGRDRSGSGVTT